MNWKYFHIHLQAWRCLFCLLLVPGVTSFSTPRKWALSATALRAGERGELTVSDPPPLNAAMIEAARKRLPWEDLDELEVAEAWETGRVWYNTRVRLVNLWVLPRDMSNGAWESYAVAASKGEEKILDEVPQLLRLPTEGIVASARAVLTNLNLPPALLRKEPLLLTLTPDRLLGGFDQLKRQQECNGGDGAAKTIEACRETPGLLANAAMEWIPRE